MIIAVVVAHKWLCYKRYNMLALSDGSGGWVGSVCNAYRVI